MYSKKVPIRTALVVGMTSALVAGLIATIGVAKVAGGGPGPTAVPAVVNTLVETHPSNRTVGEGAPRPDTSAASADRVKRALTSVDAPDQTGPVQDEPPADFDRLVLVGDSLAVAVAPVIRYVTPGMEFVSKFFGGTAPCDWIDADLETTPTTVVVISFTGNNMTPCMFDGTGAQLKDERLVDAYRADIGVLIARARAAGAWVVLVGQPHRDPKFAADLVVEGLNAVYQEYAVTIAHVSYVDAGRSVETPDGRYTDRLPCTELDTDCAPDGTTVVRGDGLHFCPVVDVNPCPVWSSGAVRFGLGIASAANDPASFD